MTKKAQLQLRFEEFQELFNKELPEGQHFELRSTAYYHTIDIMEGEQIINSVTGQFKTQDMIDRVHFLLNVHYTLASNLRLYNLKEI